MKPAATPSWAVALRPDLDAVLDALLPASPDGRFPGGSSVGILERLEGPTLEAAMLVLPKLVEEARSAGGGSVQGVAPDRWPEIVRRAQVAHPEGFTAVITHALYAYYLDPRVVAAIGLAPRAPFPDGHSVPDGDLSLLEAVYERGPFYRG
jgi:hypothetical protein